MYTWYTIEVWNVAESLEISMLRIHPSGAGERSDGMGGAENEDWS
jgi:hypothetical protein